MSTKISSDIRSIWIYLRMKCMYKSNTHFVYVIKYVNSKISLLIIPNNSCNCETFWQSLGNCYKQSKKPWKWSASLCRRVWYNYYISFFGSVVLMLSKFHQFSFHRIFHLKWATLYILLSPSDRTTFPKQVEWFCMGNIFWCLFEAPRSCFCHSKFNRKELKSL